MTDDEWNKEEALDEDWYDDDSLDDDEPDEEEAARCPECGGPVHSIADRCPACGYWLSEADRGAMWAGMSKPTWLRATAVIVLIAFLATLLAAGFTLF